MCVFVVNVVATNSTLQNTSRQDLLKWVNDCLGLQLKKVEEMCSGACYCLLFHELFPGSVPLKRVKLNVNTEYEYINNFKLLQAAFAKLRVKRTIPVDKLVKGRFQDNHEFLVWFKRFWDANCESETQLLVKSGPDVLTHHPRRQNSSDGESSRDVLTHYPPTSKSSDGESSRDVLTHVIPRPKSSDGEFNYSEESPVAMVSSKSDYSEVISKISSETPKFDFDAKRDKASAAKFIKEVTEYLADFDEVEEERDFYYVKLRRVEIYIQNTQSAVEDERVKDFFDQARQIIYEPVEGFMEPTATSKEVDGFH